MQRKLRLSFSLLGLLGAAGIAGAAEVGQDAIDACIDKVRAQSFASGGTVLSTEFSEANSLVMLQDGSGKEWRCLVSNDGQWSEISMTGAAVSGENTATADDGGGAMAGASDGTTQTVRFDAGTSGAELSGSLTPGASGRYLLGAANGQTLYVRVAHQGQAVDYQIFNPDGSALLDMTTSDQEYRGQLWQDGDHVIEVINRGGDTVSYNVIFGIE